MKNLTKEQKTILTSNLEKLNETIIKKTLFINGNRVIFCTVDDYGTIRQYFVDFESKTCLTQIRVSINETENAKGFKFE